MTQVLGFSISFLGGEVETFQFSMLGSNTQPKVLEGYIFKKLSYLVYNQIWLNLLMDDFHFGYTAKFGKKDSDSQSSALEPLVGPMVACWKLKPVDFFGGCGSSIFKLLMQPGRFYAWRTKGINNNRQQKLQSWRYSTQTNNQNYFQKLWNFHAGLKPQVGGISHSKGLRMREYGPLFWKFAQPISKH